MGNTQDPRDLGDLRARLERVERSLRHWQRLVGLGLLVATVAVVAGAADRIEKELKVHTLRIVDRDGKDRIVMTAEPKIPDLTFLDPDGRNRLTLDIAGDHKPILEFSEAGEEKGRLTIGIEDGVPMLQLYDQEGRKRVAFGVPKERGAVLRFLDENEKTHTRFP